MTHGRYWSEFSGLCWHSLMPNDASERRSVWLAMALFGGIVLLIGADLIEDSAYGADFSHLAVEGGAVLLALFGIAGLARRALSLARAKRHAELKVVALRGEADALKGEATQLKDEADALRDEADELRTKLAAQSAEAERWRAEAKDLVSGLASAIDRQFERWGLSPAEREVGLLLLKGLTHQEIADLRRVSERTVRQQARALYKKAGLGGRADLSAYFLEDLLVLEPPGS